MNFNKSWKNSALSAEADMFELHPGIEKFSLDPEKWKVSERKMAFSHHSQVGINFLWNFLLYTNMPIDTVMSKQMSKVFKGRKVKANFLNFHLPTRIPPQA